MKEPKMQKFKKGMTIVHKINGLIGEVFLIQPGRVWYSCKETGAISTIDPENAQYWEEK